jgi:hypothetical protein
MKVYIENNLINRWRGYEEGEGLFFPLWGY